MIVFDHFHVIKLFNEKLSDLRRELYREATEVLHKEVLKGTRWLLLKNPENLDPGEGREESAEGGVEAERAAGGGLLPEGGLAAVLGAAGEAIRHDVPGRVDPAGGGVGDQDPAADGQDAGGAPERVCWRTTT